MNSAPIEKTASASCRVQWHFVSVIENEEVHYDFCKTAVGEILLAKVRGMVVFLGFCESLGREAVLAECQKLLAKNRLVPDPQGLDTLVGQIFSPADDDSVPPISLLLKGSALQRSVWKTLTTIPAGERVSYSDIAARVGRPSAVRAVASAIGANPVSYLIPCHRVVGKNGQLTGYRWGVNIKAALLAAE